MTDGKKVTARNLLGNMFSNKCFWGMLLGIICGATGIGKLVLNSSVGGIVTSVISMIAAPTSAIVLLVVGYELNMKRELMKKVLITVVTRLAIMAVLLVAVSAIVTGIFGYDKELEVALMVLYSLPAPFIIPMFADLGDDSEYVSTTLSVNTVVTIILFALSCSYSECVLNMFFLKKISEQLFS
jgi:predicted permease